MRFDAEAPLWRYEGDAAWMFVTLPHDVAEEIRDAVPRRGGFGSVRVRVTVGATTWSTSVFPDKRSGSFVLPMKRAVRVAERIEEGDLVQFSLELVGI